MSQVFLDTNVLIYTLDQDEPAKQQQAGELLGKLAEEGSVLLSTQVLQEFYVVSTTKLRSPLSPERGRAAVAALTAFSIVTVTPEIVLAAVRLHQSERLSFWDSLIIQAALSGGAELLYSEDLQSGRQFGRLQVENPFQDQPLQDERGGGRS